MTIDISQLIVVHQLYYKVDYFLKIVVNERYYMDITLYTLF